MTWDVLEGDCVDLMADMEAGCVDAVVCDPPYSLGFMSKPWDMQVDHGRWAVEALRVLKPGGHLLAFGGTRTYHRLVCALEDAGFEIRDCLAWIYGSGFPKSLNLSGEWEGWGTALKPAHEPIVLARKPLSGTVAENVLTHGTGALNVDATRIGASSTRAYRGAGSNGGTDPSRTDARTIRTPDTQHPGASGGPHVQHERPAPSGCECDQPWTGLPDSPGGCPACRRSDGEPSPIVLDDGLEAAQQLGGAPESPDPHGEENGTPESQSTAPDNYTSPLGRWPANVILDEQAAAMLDEQTGELTSGALDRSRITSENLTYGRAPRERNGTYEPNAGGASRFFYVAKASRAERNAGLEGFEERDHSTWRKPVRECSVCGSRTKAAGPDNGAPWPTCGHGSWEWVAERDEAVRGGGRTRNHHPTVKPASLMRWLVRLVTPPGGLVLDPFAGSGTTGIAATLEGFRFLGVEREPEYVDLARARIAWWAEHGEDALRIVREREAAEAERAATEAAGQLGLEFA